MTEKFVDIVYDLANGTRIPQLGDPQVQDLFAPGSECEKLYSTVYEAKLRLCQQLGEEENADVEIIIDSLLRICKIMGKKMYGYGVKYGHK